MRQLDLASDAENSSKRLGLMETGRLKPGRGILLHLAACLDVPLRQKNALLSAAGSTPSLRNTHSMCLRWTSFGAESRLCWRRMILVQPW